LKQIPLGIFPPQNKPGFAPESDGVDPCHLLCVLLHDTRKVELAVVPTRAADSSTPLLPYLLLVTPVNFTCTIPSAMQRESAEPGHEAFASQLDNRILLPEYR